MKIANEVRPGPLSVVVGGELLRFLCVTFGGAVLLALCAWLTAVSALLPISTVFAWAVAALSTAGGFSLQVGAVTIGLAPTGLTLLLWWLVYRTARRASRGLAEVFADVDLAARASRELLGLGAMAAIIMGLLALGVTLNPLSSMTVLGCIRAGLLVLTAVAFGALQARAWVVEGTLRRFGQEWADALIAGPRLAARTAVGLLILVHLALIAAIIVHFDAVRAVLDSYSNPVASAIGLGVLQTLYAPTIWSAALSWLMGTGIDLSVLAHVSVFEGSELPRPPLPVVALIPEDPAAWLPVLIAAPALIACVCVIARGGWLRSASWPALAIAVVSIAAGAGLLSLFIHGAAGPGGLSVFGVPPLPFVGALVGLTAVGLVVGHLMGSARDRYDASAD